MKRQDNIQALEQRVLRHIRDHQLFSEQRRLLVAVSGGPDSVCLLHILLAMVKESDTELHVAHLDHRLRGADSAGDARFVSRLAESLGIPVTIGERDVRAYQTRRRISLEEAAWIDGIIFPAE